MRLVRWATLPRKTFCDGARLWMAGVWSDLRAPPGNRLEALKGDRKGQYSVRISDRWRICFAWAEGDAYDVEIVDYR